MSTAGCAGSSAEGGGRGGPGRGRGGPGLSWAGGAGHGWDGGQVAHGTPSHSGARGCARLVQPQRFTQPAGKIHFFHLGPLDEGVALQGEETRVRKERGPAGQMALSRSGRRCRAHQAQVTTRPCRRGASHTLGG